MTVAYPHPPDAAFACTCPPAMAVAYPQPLAIAIAYQSQPVAAVVCEQGAEQAWNNLCEYFLQSAVE